MKKKKFGSMISRGTPGPGDGGRTGSWRIVRPVINVEICIPAKTHKKSCFACWLHCPEGVITKTIPPTIDYEYCKGCGICAEECPAGAITMEDESSFIKEEK